MELEFRFLREENRSHERTLSSQESSFSDKSEDPRTSVIFSLDDLSTREESMILIILRIVDVMIRRNDTGFHNRYTLACKHAFIHYSPS